MSTSDVTEFLVLVGAVVAGVIVAGWVMSEFRSSVGFIGQAHTGYDS